ncbi:hypothetical protein ACFL4G_11070 [Thermodesulfobacteriota bacterium]
MADQMGISVQALGAWIRRQEGDTSRPSRRGRPEEVSAHVRWRIRVCYLAHYRQWGPRVLAAWAERKGMGTWCAATMARVIDDLRPEPEPKHKPIRYEISAPMVMWSEDGTGFRDRGKKKELLVVQDEHARFKVNHRLAGGPANEDDVYDYLTEAFDKHGAPLVLKHDNDSIFRNGKIRKLLDDYGVIELFGPTYYPQYNGKQERSMRDIKSYERAMRGHGIRGSLEDRIREAIHDLNEQRPRPVLAGRTAREAMEGDQICRSSRQDTCV